MAPTNPFTPTETKALGRFKAVMETFGVKSPRIERQEVLCLMWVAVQPGINRTELMKKGELTEASVTRCCQRLIGYGWLAQGVSAERSNAVAYELTTAGAAFLRRAAAILGA